MVTLDAACDFAIQELRLPVRNVLRGLSPSRFYCPGAILGVTVDNRHPLAHGMAEQASAYFLNSAAFELLPEPKDAAATVVVRYSPGNPLQSGWIGGPDHLRDRAAVVEVTRGMGKVVLLGFRVQFRAQPNGTFPLLFNALFGAASGAAGDPRGATRPAPVPIPAARARASAPPPG